MAQPPKVLRKNYFDIDFSGSATVTDAVASNDGADFLGLLQNRNNESGWMTTGSTDAAETQLDIDLGDVKEVDTMILLGMNFKDFEAWYYDPDTLAWISLGEVEDNTLDTYEYYLGEAVFAQLWRIKIYGTMVVDADKIMNQLIITQRVGQFIGWPGLKTPTMDRGRKNTETLSGKIHQIQKVGNFSIKLEFKKWPEAGDFALLEEMFFYLAQGFLFWPSGGDETQFRSKRIGYRNIDLYLMKVTSEWNPEWEMNIYQLGLNLSLSLGETI
jgi:hypothetical protein